MNQPSNRMRAAAALFASAAAEAIWPTRCAVCERPGRVLCARCEANLPYLDWWRACPRCGAPFGRVQCCECSSVTLAHLARTSYPYEGCVSAVLFDESTGRIVRTFKDAGERRLATACARIMARSIPPGWEFDAVSFVPASREAQRRRGFDHGALLGAAVAAELDLPTRPLLAPPTTKDQRGLSKMERIGNVGARFRPLPAARIGGRVLVVDDVYTTGATMCAAVDALRVCGCRVYGATFARA